MMMRKNSHFQNGWMGKWMNYMEICANFENGACQWWSEEGRWDEEGGGCFARLLRSAPCQKVSDFGTWGMFVIIIISPGEAAHFSQSSRLGGAAVGAESVGVVVLCIAGLGQTFMNYGCQFFLRCCVLRPGEEALSLALIFWKYFSAHFTFTFFLSSVRWGL